MTRKLTQSRQLFSAHLLSLSKKLSLITALLMSSLVHSEFKYKIEEVASDLYYPWAMAFIDPQNVLLSERTGRLLIVDHAGNRTEVEGLPKDVYVAGQGGLQDVIVHPDFAQNQWLYLSYAAGSADANRLKVIRATLAEDKLIEVTPIFSAQPAKDTPVHYGARMAFLPDNSLLISSGDGFDFREDAQKYDSQLGKILRVTQNGDIPANNPFYQKGGESLQSAIFSLGHRNPQGLVYDPQRKVIFSNEHGPAGGDEINIIHAGSNYGWPVVTNGRDYSGASISPFTDYPGMALPLVDWTPSIAPSSLAVYYGAMFPQLQGDLLSSTLKSREVRWVKMDGLTVQGQTSLFTELKQRIRQLVVHEDGSLYLLTDGEKGKILRVAKD